MATLDIQSQYHLALLLTKHTLTIWDNYTETHKFEYIDTVIDMDHFEVFLFQKQYCLSSNNQKQTEL